MSKTVDKESTVYISREAVDDVLCDLSERTQTYPFMAIAVAMAIDKIDSIPNADVASVVHGHWCEDEFDVWCSNCFCAYPKDGTGIAGWRKISKYCDNCGAKMDESEESGND